MLREASVQRKSTVWAMSSGSFGRARGSSRDQSRSGSMMPAIVSQLAEGDLKVVLPAN